MSKKDRTFDGVVRDDMFSDIPNMELREPAMLGKWLFHLGEVVASVDRQLANDKTQADAALDHLHEGRLSLEDHGQLAADRLSWRARALTIQSRAQHRLNEARALQARLDDVVAVRLTEAIRAHRETSVENGIDPEPHDLALWELVGS